MNKAKGVYMNDKTTNERFPAQHSPELHFWLEDKSRETGASIAALLRGLPAVLEQAEQAGIKVTPVYRTPDQRAQA